MRLRFTARLAASAALLLGAITAALTVGPGDALASAARTAVPNIPAPGNLIVIHSLYKKTPNQCLDADLNGGGVNGNKVQVWACNGSTQQEWVTNPGVGGGVELESAQFPGMCLDADVNGGGANGTKVQLWQCNGQSQQSWVSFPNDLAIYNVRFFNGGNTVLDRDINVPGNGARAQLWTKNFQSQQWWQVVIV